MLSSRFRYVTFEFIGICALYISINGEKKCFFASYVVSIRHTLVSKTVLFFFCIFIERNRLCVLCCVECMYMFMHIVMPIQIKGAQNRNWQEQDWLRVKYTWKYMIAAADEYPLLRCSFIFYFLYCKCICLVEIYQCICTHHKIRTRKKNKKSDRNVWIRDLETASMFWSILFNRSQKKFGIDTKKKHKIHWSKRKKK